MCRYLISRPVDILALNPTLINDITIPECHSSPRRENHPLYHVTSGSFVIMKLRIRMCASAFHKQRLVKQIDFFFVRNLIFFARYRVRLAQLKRYHNQLGHLIRGLIVQFLLLKEAIRKSSIRNAKRRKDDVPVKNKSINIFFSLFRLLRSFPFSPPPHKFREYLGWRIF